MSTKLKAHLLRRITILRWLPKYKKMDFISDLIAGVTLGLTMMPQAIAYANVAGVPTQYGLYTAFMGCIVYVFFGTIKEVSIGPTNLISLLVFSYTDGLSMDHKILLCFTTGLVIFVMGVCRLGFCIDFISAPVTTAFTTATSVVIISTQLKGILGINVKGKGLIELYVNMFKEIGNVKFADFILGVVSIIVLLFIRKIGQLKVKNYKLKKSLWLLSISRNALVVMITSAVAYLIARKRGGVPFDITGDIPAGLPPFKFPNLTTVQNNETITVDRMVLNLGFGVIVLPVVAVLQNIAIAKAFSTGVAVDATQELMTLGLANMLGSFVQAIPASGAFTRSAVSNASGIRTPFAGVYTATIILFALAFLTPFFYYIPKSVLSAVLMSTMVFMIDYEIGWRLWRFYRFDFYIYSICLTFCLLLGVEIGLFVGILISTGSLLKSWTRPKIITTIYETKLNEKYLIVKPELGLYFPAVNYMTEEIKKASLDNKIPIIIDFVNFIDVDYSACQCIKTLVENFGKQKREIFCYNLNEEVLKKVKSSSIDGGCIITSGNVQDLSDGKLLENDEEKSLLNENRFEGKV